MQNDHINEAEALWKSCTKNLRLQMSDATWKAWFEALRPVDADEHTFVLSAPSSTVRNRMETRFRALVEDTLTNVAGQDMGIRVHVRPGEELTDDEETVEAESGEIWQLTFPSSRAEDVRSEPAALNPRYTFAAFVTGASNSFALAASSTNIASVACGSASMGNTRLATLSI